jgi:hypothetical protein
MNIRPVVSPGAHGGTTSRTGLSFDFEMHRKGVMNPHLCRMMTADLNPSNRQSPKQDDADPGCPPIGLLSFLEAENVRLRQAIVELSRDAKTLKEALDKMEARPGRGRFYRPHTGPAKAVVTSGERESAVRPPLRTRSADQPTN